MASPQHLEVDIELKCNTEKLWDCVKNSTTVIPKAFPDKFFEVIEGDGISAGTVFLVKFKEGHPFSAITNRVEIVDDEKKLFSYSMIGGDIMKSFDKFTTSMVLTSKGEDGTSMKWRCDFIKKSEDVPIKAEDMLENAIHTAHGLEDYVLKGAC